MPTVAVDICNLALRKLGVAPITTLGSDLTPQDNFFALPTGNPMYARLWKAVMRAAPWNPLRARSQLQYTSMGLTLSSLAVGAGVTATAAATIFISRDVGAILRETGTGATGVATITGYTSGTVVTVTNTVAWSTLTPAANAWLIDPIGDDFIYLYVLPSDFLAVRAVDSDTASWQVESNRLLVDTAVTTLLYTRYESSPDLWDALLEDAIIARLAMEAAWPLTKDAKLVVDMEALYGAKLREAQGENTRERQPQHPRILRTVLSDIR